VPGSLDGDTLLLLPASAIDRMYDPTSYQSCSQKPPLYGRASYRLVRQSDPNPRGIGQNASRYLSQRNLGLIALLGYLRGAIMCAIHLWHLAL
jgi:hypothetical protein